MRLFKEKNAEQLQDSLIKLVDKYSEDLNLREIVENKVKKIDKHTKFGMFTGLGVGAVGVVGGIGAIAISPAVATIAVGFAGFTIAGAAIMAGGAALVSGLSYAGISQLVKKATENCLGSSYEQASEEHRLKMVDIRMQHQFNRVMNRASDYQQSASSDDLYDIQRAIKANDFNRATGIVEKMSNEVKFKNSTKTNKP